MRLGYVLDAFPKRSESFIRREVLALARQGVELELFVLREVPPAERLDTAEAAAAAGPAVTRLACGAAELARLPLALLDGGGGAARGAGWRRIPAILRLAAEVRRRGLRHLHAQFAGLPARVAAAAARRAGIGWSISAHARDVFVPGPTRAEDLAGARGVVCCSAALREAALARWPELDPARTAVVYHGLPLDEYPFQEPEEAAAAPAAPGRPLRLFAAGRLVPKKGYAGLLAAVAELLRAGRPVELTLAGDGPERPALERLARGLAATVRLAGWLDAAALRAAMLRAEVVVVPSVVAPDGDQDNLSNVILEAQALGRPVVASRLAGIPEAVADGATGLLVPPGDAAALAAALARLADDAPLRRRLARAARTQVEARFAVEGSAARLAELFAGWLGEPAEPGAG